MSLDKEWLKDYLDAHNKYRALHQAGPLKYNDKLSKLAQEWADYLAEKDTFKHSPCEFQGGPLGENLAMKMSSTQTDFPANEFVDLWYSEIERYDFDANKGPQTGHFTQVVWKGSREMGVGKARTKSGKVLVVGNYLPAGNFVGRYAVNVLPTKDGKVTLPKKDEPKPLNLSPVKVTLPKTKSTSVASDGDDTPAIVKGFVSMRQSKLSRSLSDGRTAFLTTDYYTMKDGTSHIVRKKSVL